MAVIPGTSGDDIYTGTVGTPDTAQVSATQNTSTFRWDGTKWMVFSTAGNDQLISIESVQLADATFQLTGAGSFNFGLANPGNLNQAGSVARLGDGSYIHVLSPYTGGDLNVEASRISSIGELLSGPTTVNTTTAGFQQSPDIAVLTTGDYVVTWQGQDNFQDGIFMQRYSAAGVALGGEVQVTGVGFYNEITGQVTALTGGRYLVTWVNEGADGSGFGVYGRIYSSAGVASGSEFRISTTTFGEQRNVSIAALSDGGFAATYASDSELRFQRFTSTGLATGLERGFVGSGLGHASAVLSGDKIVVATVEGSQLTVVTLDANGVQTLVPKAVVGDAGNATFNPAITTLSDGGYVVAWYAPHAGSPFYDLQVQRYDSTGARVGGAQVISNTQAAGNYSIEIAADAAGGYAVQFLEDGHLLAYRYDSDNLFVQPSITGDDAANNIRAALVGAIGVRLNGGLGNDHLFGSALNDILDGGEGNDRLTGGEGNDTYLVTQTDRIIETETGGTDTVIVRDNYVLTARNVENIEARGTAAINLTGNLLDNTILGNKADNQINGGRGLDTMIGGAGNDTYFVDVYSDTVIERAGEGIDTVVTSAGSYALPDNVENLRASGTGQMNLYGNAADNLIVGNNVRNSLISNGGADILEGKGGDDDYYVSDARTQIIERAGPTGGDDTVISAVSLVLDANVENLFLSGDNALNGTGNDLNNNIYGN